MIRIALIAMAIIVMILGTVAGMKIDPKILAPDAEEAASIVFGDLIDFQNLHGTSHVVFEHNGRVYLDQLRRDWKTLSWVLTGKWYFIDESDDPATVGVARCTGILGEVCDKDTELFGQINSDEIATLEVAYDGAWHEFDIGPDGYVVRLDGFHEAPDEYRWLD